MRKGIFLWLKSMRDNVKKEIKMGYEEPTIKIITIKEEDVITTSGHGWEF